MMTKKDVENKLRLRQLLGLPSELIMPDYGNLCIDSIPATILEIFTDDSNNTNNLAQALELPSKPTISKVLLLIIDGLGYLQLNRFLDRFSGLYLHKLIKRGAYLPITSVFPPTTATALTTFSTGCTPQEHGMLGFRLFLKEISAITNMVRLSLLGNGNTNSVTQAGMDLDTFLGVPTLYQQLGDLGVTSHLLLSKYIASSGLSSILYRGSDSIRPTVNFSDMLVTARKILQNAEGKTFVSSYWGGTDAIAHMKGPNTDEFTAEFRAVDSALEREFDGELEDVLFIVCSDHGFVSMTESDYLMLSDYPRLNNNLVIPPVGETRSSYLFTKQGKAEETAQFIDDKFSDELVCINSQQALNAGLFGAGKIKPEVHDRIGDLIALSTKKKALYHSYPNSAKLPGMHGGMTADEMLVPLISCLF